MVDQPETFNSMDVDSLVHVYQPEMYVDNVMNDQPKRHDMF
jgi:hypothetical protein